MSQIVNLASGGIPLHEVLAYVAMIIAVMSACAGMIFAISAGNKLREIENKLHEIKGLYSALIEYVIQTRQSDSKEAEVSKSSSANERQSG